MSETYSVAFKHRLARPILKAGFRILFHILGRVNVTGLENIPYGKPYVVAMNHVSMFDPPLIGSFWPEILEIIAASEVFKKPGQGQILNLYGMMKVNRGGYDRTLMKQIFARIKAGYPLLISPEGKRSKVPGMLLALPGTAYIVEKTKVPVIPVGLVGTTEDYWQRAKRGEKPQLEIRIGQPIDLPPITGKGPARREARQRNSDLVLQYVAGLLPESYRGVYAESAITPAHTG